MRRGSTIRVQGWTDNGSVILQVMDEGPGIPPADLERIFDTFYRVRKGDRFGPAPGSACRSAAVSSRRWAARSQAENRTDRPGAVFTIKYAGAGRAPNLDAAAKPTDQIGDLP
jgi:two-component system sensor histidine kinase KdpD